MHTGRRSYKSRKGIWRDSCQLPIQVRGIGNDVIYKKFGTVIYFITVPAMDMPFQRADVICKFFVALSLLNYGLVFC